MESSQKSLSPFSLRPLPVVRLISCFHAFSFLFRRARVSGFLTRPYTKKYPWCGCSVFKFKLHHHCICISSGGQRSTSWCDSPTRPWEAPHPGSQQCGILRTSSFGLETNISLPLEMLSAQALLATCASEFTSGKFVVGDVLWHPSMNILFPALYCWWFRYLSCHK